jgi:cation diffusion facilitator CzcD-associated flavoprotein CzcO
MTAAEVVDRTDRVAVIGAGSSGLAAVKNLTERGFAVDCFEASDDVGGNWSFGKPTSRVYASTHTISSKPFTQYPDFPMPDEFPDYPHHGQLRDYFRAYARHFRLDRHIRFGTEVVRVAAYDNGKAWDVTVRASDGTHTARYDAVVVANGHNWVPKVPDYPGRFTGEVLHSADYKSPDVLRGKRVLVVGAGNTGCDIAVESAQNALATHHSTRRGYWYMPKYIYGRPADQIGDLMLALRAPLWLRRAMFKRTVRTTVGRPERYGLPRPDHEPFETHPIVNSLLLYYVGHGDIRPRPDVARFDGGTVRFVDGTSAEVDLVLFATGYLARFPFLDEGWLNWRDGRPHLFQNVFVPGRDNLFVAGLIQPDSGQFTLAHWQTVAIAELLTARRDRPAAVRAFLERAAADVDHRYSAGAHYKESTRHYFEVAHADYLRGLERSINQLRGAA